MSDFQPLKGLGVRNIESIPTVKQFNIFPRIVQTKVFQGEYYLTFQNMCASTQIFTTTVKFDSSELERKLNFWIRPDDRKYIKLVSFNANQSIYKFDVDLWLQDALKDSMPSVNFSTFTKSYRFKKALPYMIRVYGMPYVYEKHIADKFKNALKKQPKTRENIFSMITSITGKVLGLDKINYFEYKYNWQSNTVTVNLKPIYFASVLAAASLYLKKKDVKKPDFDKTTLAFLKLK